MRVEAVVRCLVPSSRVFIIWLAELTNSSLAPDTNTSPLVVSLIVTFEVRVGSSKSRIFSPYISRNCTWTLYVLFGSSCSFVSMISNRFVITLGIMPKLSPPRRISDDEAEPIVHVLPYIIRIIDKMRIIACTFE